MLSTFSLIWFQKCRSCICHPKDPSPFPAVMWHNEVINYPLHSLGGKLDLIKHFRKLSATYNWVWHESNCFSLGTLLNCSNQNLIWVWVWIRGLNWQCSVSCTAAGSAVTGCAFCQHVRCSELVRQERQKSDGVGRKSQTLNWEFQFFSFWLQGNITCSFSLKLTPICDWTLCEEEDDVDNMYCTYVGERQSVPEVW